MTNVTVTSGKMVFAGQQHTYIAASGQINGVMLYERMVVVKCQNYVVMITATSAYTNSTKAMLDMFKPYSA